MSELDSLYREVILDHYKNPRGHGVIDGADAEAEGQNPLCGDEVSIAVAFDGDTIADVKFQGRGCAISQASASLLTDEVKGRPVADVVGFGAADLLDLLGIEISPARRKCAMLSFDSLQHLLDEIGAKPITREPG